MKTTIDFLTDLKSAYSLISDGQLSRLLSITRSAIGKPQGGNDFLGDKNAIKVANLLKIDPAFVLASVHLNAQKRPKKRPSGSRLWRSLSGLPPASFLALRCFLRCRILPAPTAFF